MQILAVRISLFKKVLHYSLWSSYVTFLYKDL